MFLFVAKVVILYHISNKSARKKRHLGYGPFIYSLHKKIVHFQPVSPDTRPKEEMHMSFLQL